MMALHPAAFHVARWLAVVVAPSAGIWKGKKQGERREGGEGGLADEWARGAVREKGEARAGGGRLMRGPAVLWAGQRAAGDLRARVRVRADEWGQGAVRGRRSRRPREL